MKNIFILIFITLLSTINSNLFCSEEFCESYTSKNICRDIPEECLVQNDTHNGIFLPAPVPCSCCSYCLENLYEGNICAKGDPSSPVPTSVCGHGLGCTKTSPTKDGVCKKVYDTTCRLALKKYEDDRESGILGHLQVKPKCNRNGYYEPFVCVPGEICYCVSENGIRLFGEIAYMSKPEFILHCKCARNHFKEADVREEKLHPGDYFRCQSDGNYDTLQCIDDKCFCVDEEDGHLTDSTPPLVNISLISSMTLPCFNNKTHRRGNYYHECEILYREQLEIIREYKTEGYEVFGYDLPNCQIDGRFAAVQENSTMKYCADLYGNLLESFMVEKTNSLSLSMDCKCARSRSLIIEGNKPECCMNGNYKKMQCRRGLCRCVDENGVQIEKEVEYQQKETLLCAKNVCS